jgi:phospholipid-binding lipoprotein MlaA
VLAQEVYDPLEPWNRSVFAFNEGADRYLLRPVAKGYRAITPNPVERGVARVFSNLGELPRAVNGLLQGEIGQAANDVGRFLVNSTIGLLGFFDVASGMGMERHSGADFGQTLGKWGVGSGPYLVLPLLGPSNLRDGSASFVNAPLSPEWYIDDNGTRNVLLGLRLVSFRAQLLDAESLISGDKYVFMRGAYTQRRAALISDGDREDTFTEDLDDFDALDDPPAASDGA